MSFRQGSLRFFSVIIACFFSIQTFAQQDTSIYKGLRISLFGFEIAEQKSESVSLRLHVANTGRLPVSLGKKKEASPPLLVIELDTVNLPVILQGRESLITGAVRLEKINLNPGEILRDLKLKIKMKPPELMSQPEISGGDSPGKNCPDLIFDTAVILQYTDEIMQLRYFIRNAGDAPAHLLGETDDIEDNLAVNVYFVSGTKLTRGAIFADGAFIREGRETLDGILLPGQALQGDLEISLKNRTRFSPNLLFELDPFQKVNECKKTNNTLAVEVEY